MHALMAYLRQYDNLKLLFVNDRYPDFRLQTLIPKKKCFSFPLLCCSVDVIFESLYWKKTRCFVRDVGRLEYKMISIQYLDSDHAVIK